MSSQKNRSEYIRTALANIIACFESRAEFMSKLGSLYPNGTVTRATLSLWVSKGDIPAKKAMHLASWSDGKYKPDDLCSDLKLE